MLRKIAGPTCHICFLPAPLASVSLSFLSSRRHRSVPSLADSTPPACTPLAQAAATRSLRHRRSWFARARTRRSRAATAARVCHCPRAAAAVRFRAAATATPCHRHAQSRRSYTTHRPRSSTLHAAAAAHSRSVLARCSIYCLTEMGREKRKGKEVMVKKPVRKRTRAEREAKRAEMVAKAAEEQASGRARLFSIREQPSRGRGRGRGMGRVRGARATRATTQQTEGDLSEGEPAAAESDRSDSEAAQSEQSQGESTQRSPTLRQSVALGRRPQEQSLHQRPSVAPGPGREVVTSHRCLVGPQLQQLQLAEPRP